jgi:hypothetical protein
MSDPIPETPGRLLYSNSLPRLSFLALVLAGVAGLVLAQTQPFAVAISNDQKPLAAGAWLSDSRLASQTERLEYRLESAAGEVLGSARLDFSLRLYERPGFPGHGRRALVIQSSIQRRNQSSTERLVLDASQLSSLWNLRAVQTAPIPSAVLVDARFEGGTRVLAFWGSKTSEQGSIDSPWPVLQVLAGCRAGQFSESEASELWIRVNFFKPEPEASGQLAELRLTGTVLAANEGGAPSPCRDWRLSQKEGGAWRFLLNPDRIATPRQIEDARGERWTLISQTWVAHEADPR